MKKYVQFIVVMGIFGALVLFRQLKGGDAAPVVVPPSTPQSSPSQDQSITVPPTTTSDAVTQIPTPTTASTGGSSGQYKDGTYTGPVTDAFYGNYQVQAIIKGGKLADIVFLQYPNDNRTSLSINEQAMVFLKQEALAAQSANVDIVSGASDSSQAFRQSLASALSQAK